MFQSRPTRRALAPLAVMVLALGAAACGGDDDDEDAATGGGSGEGDAVTIALLLPESSTARYETQDRPLFEAKVEELCPDCEIIYSNADQDAAEQQSQAEAALTNGADVLVLDPVDGASAGSMVAQAEAQDVPVLAYDRLIPDAPIDYYISYDNERVGQLQAEALTERLAEDGEDSGTIVMINGAPTDNNATQFKEGAHSVIDESPYEVGAEYDTPDWSADEAQSQMEQAITRLGADGFVGVYAANDGTAGGAIAAMRSSGVDPIPPVTGQDAELAGIQRILAGDQYMTVYKAIKPQAEISAEVAIALARGEDPPEDQVNQQVDNGEAEIPSMILDPVAVTADNVADTVVADGFWTADQICEGDFAAACEEAGIS
ncbi:MAG TPA: sugar ABC transporter substrate-binding protein [Acidimicrobiales bacterium]|nr:sugar ABC transporter substrate-binding protein [Acidimicrobiales bacterium]